MNCDYYEEEWFIFFFKQKTAYEMRISDWSSDVCSSDLAGYDGLPAFFFQLGQLASESCCFAAPAHHGWRGRSEEHTSELQSLMRISYAVFCLKKKKNKQYTPLKIITKIENIHHS